MKSPAEISCSFFQTSEQQEKVVFKFCCKGDTCKLSPIDPIDSLYVPHTKMWLETLPDINSLNTLKGWLLRNEFVNTKRSELWVSPGDELCGSWAVLSYRVSEALSVNADATLHPCSHLGFYIGCITVFPDFIPCGVFGFWFWLGFFF